MKVLVVDDEPDFLKQVTTFLEKEDDRLDVETAPSAERGLDRVSEEDFDAIVSDYVMPEMNGLDFLIALRDGGVNIPFVMLTGRGKEDVAMEALNLGADRYVRKGLDPNTLYRVLARTIIDEVEKHRAEESIRELGEEYKQVFENMGVPTIVMERDTTIKMANEEFENLSGYSENELENKKKLREFLTRSEKSGEEHKKWKISSKSNSKTERFGFEDKDGNIWDTVLNISIIPETNELAASILRIGEIKKQVETKI